MRAHFEHLTKFKSSLAGEKFANQASMERKDMRLLLVTALHAADISNPAKPQQIATAWAKRYAHTQHNHGASTLSLSLSEHTPRSLILHTYPSRSLSYLHPRSLPSISLRLQLDGGALPTRRPRDGARPLRLPIHGPQQGPTRRHDRQLPDRLHQRPRAAIAVRGAVFLGDSAERDIVNTLEGTLRLWRPPGPKSSTRGAISRRSRTRQRRRRHCRAGQDGDGRAARGRAPRRREEVLTTKGDESHRVKV